jgi:hypothetical protein
VTIAGSRDTDPEFGEVVSPVDVKRGAARAWPWVSVLLAAVAVVASLIGSRRPCLRLRDGQTEQRRRSPAATYTSRITARLPCLARSAFAKDRHLRDLRKPPRHVVRRCRRMAVRCRRMRVGEAVLVTLR